VDVAGAAVPAGSAALSLRGVADRRRIIICSTVAGFTAGVNRSYLCVPGLGFHKKGHVHHVNGIKRDDRPDNVVILSVFEHRRVHSLLEFLPRAFREFFLNAVCWLIWSSPRMLTRANNFRRKFMKLAVPGND